MCAMNRRDFIKALSACACGVASQRIIFPVEDAFAAVSCGVANRTLVHIYLDGGMDVASYLVPRNLQSYVTARPSIGVTAPAALSGSNDLGLHPNLAVGALSLQAHYDAGRVALFPFTGYPKLNGSHDEAQHIYATGMTNNNRGIAGWAGRIGDSFCQAGDNIAVFSFRGRIDEVAATSFVAASAGNLSNYGFLTGPSTAEGRYARAITSQLLALDSSQDPQAVIYRNARGTIDGTVSSVQAARNAYNALASNQKATYQNDGLSQRLKDTAALLRGGLNPTVVFVSMGGFDTHDNQFVANSGNFAGKMTTLNNAIGSFLDDLDKAGSSVRDNVAILVESEFSRTAKENGTLGTDHGGAICATLIGYRVRGGIYGRSAYNDADFTDRRNLFLASTDFREVRANIYANFLGIDPSRVQPESYAQGAINGNVFI